MDSRFGIQYEIGDRGAYVCTEAIILAWTEPVASDHSFSVLLCYGCSVSAKNAVGAVVAIACVGG